MTITSLLRRPTQQTDQNKVSTEAPQQPAIDLG